MGCASSAPFMGEGGALGEIKDTTNNLIESGEQALHDIEEKVHQAIDNVKEVVMDSGKKILNPSEAEPTAPMMNGEATKEYSITTEDEDLLEDIMSTPTPEATKDMFRPTPAPSFEKPLTPATTRLHPSTDDNVDESLVNVTIDELTDQLIKDTDDVPREENEPGRLINELREGDIENSENLDLESDLPPTKWEALADCIVELPPRMSIDLGTGQLYAIVEDEAPKAKFGKSPVLKEMSGEAHAGL